MLPLRIYNNKAVIGNLGIPIHLGSNEKLTLDCICLAQFRSALLTTLSAIEEVLLLTSYQTMSTRNKIGAAHHTEGNSQDTSCLTRASVYGGWTGWKDCSF